MAIPMPMPDGRVGLLAAADLPVDCCASCFTAAERDLYAAFRSERRRQEWLAGRIATKFLFLKREQGGSESGELRLEKITPCDLRQFSPADYRGVIVTRAESGAAQAGRADAPAVRAAISHTNGLACAFLDGPETCSVDLEVLAPRAAAFHIYNFTAGERTWTHGCANRLGIRQDWLYTLLWSAKECLLKTAQFAAFSLWNMSSIELNLPSAPEGLRAIYDACAYPRFFEIMDAEAGHARFQLAVSGTSDSVLTVVTKIDPQAGTAI